MAAELQPNDVTVWLIWGNMQKKIDKTPEAEKYLSKALKIDPNNPVVLNSLAWVKCYLGEHKEADQLFRKAFKLEFGRSSLHKIINYQGIAENLRRWAEILIREHSYEPAIEKLEDAYRICNSALELDHFDERLLILKQKIAIVFMQLATERINILKAAQYFKDAIIKDKKQSKILENNVFACVIFSQKLIDSKNFEEAIKTAKIGLDYVPKSYTNSDRLVRLQNKLSYFASFRLGYIKTFISNKNYGFIVPYDDERDEYYFNISNILTKSGAYTININSNVMFKIRKPNKKPDEAYDIYV
jgi:tetratricopeptide (TPR) repeat protein